MRSVFTRSLAPLVLPVLAACGGGKDCCSPPPSGNGSFTASVTGAKSASLAGQAGILTGANIFTIALRDASNPAINAQISHIGAARSVGAQRRRRIDAGDASRGNERRDDRGNRERQRRDEIGERFAW